jgi:hypothetical protein
MKRSPMIFLGVGVLAASYLSFWPVWIEPAAWASI